MFDQWKYVELSKAFGLRTQLFLDEVVPKKKLLPDEVLDEVDSRNLLL
jgi:hypothetical protein